MSAYQTISGERGLYNPYYVHHVLSQTTHNMCIYIYIHMCLYHHNSYLVYYLYIWFSLLYHHRYHFYPYCYKTHIYSVMWQTEVMPPVNLGFQGSRPCRSATHPTWSFPAWGSLISIAKPMENHRKTIRKLWFTGICIGFTLRFHQTWLAMENGP